MPSDCREFERMLDKGDYEGILREATEYDFGVALNESDDAVVVGCVAVAQASWLQHAEVD